MKFITQSLKDTILDHGEKIHNSFTKKYEKKVPETIGDSSTLFEIPHTVLKKNEIKDEKSRQVHVLCFQNSTS